MERLKEKPAGPGPQRVNSILTGSSVPPAVAHIAWDSGLQHAPEDLHRLLTVLELEDRGLVIQERLHVEDQIPRSVHGADLLRLSPHQGQDASHHLLVFVDLLQTPIRRFQGQGSAPAHFEGEGSIWIIESEQRTQSVVVMSLLFEPSFDRS